ncbi:UDP-glucose-4-epimerase [Serendipita sp. 397]|nr:UDP-glucose-4-epimerase [Serendipita sp. 397]
MYLAEKGCVDAVLPFNLVRELFECLSISSCSQVFSWVERRGKRLCIGKPPTTGLNLLRTLNELLRSLSKSTQTEFCARILVFLNDIFPLSDKSGVNLQGEYGPTWEGPPPFQEGKELLLKQAEKEEKRPNEGGQKDESVDVKMSEMDLDLVMEDKRARLFHSSETILEVYTLNSALQNILVPSAPLLTTTFVYRPRRIQSVSICGKQGITNSL